MKAAPSRVAPCLSKTLRAVVEYDGTDFKGLQWQAGLRTVAGELETALGGLLQEPVKITAAGRTDAGVHACGQVVSFKTGRDFPIERMALALNANLPPDLSVRRVDVVDDAFSARFSALERRYVYVVYNRRMRSALFERYAYHFYGAVDLDALRQAASALIGEHDFRSFCGILPETGPTVRNVFEISAERFNEAVAITIRADGFLHRMVRNIIGTLLEVANGRRAVESVAAALVSRHRPDAGHTAPAQGLYLAGVRYQDFDSYAPPPILQARPT